MYTRQQEPLLRDIERTTKTAFTRVGAPQVADLIRSSASVLESDLMGVEDEVLPHFKDIAEKLIEQRGATGALAAAIAHIVGYKTAASIMARSMLSSMEGWVTFQYSAGEGNALDAPGGTAQVWTELRKELPDDAVGSIRGVTMFKDDSGAVFDVPASHVKVLSTAAKEEGSRVSMCVTLPELKERPTLGARAGGGVARE